MIELQKRLRDAYKSLSLCQGLSVGYDTFSEAADALDARDAEIARLTAELAQTQRDRQAEHDLRVTMQGEAETLRARLAAAERDAGRYRWLRTRINWSDNEIAEGHTPWKVTANFRAWCHYDYRANRPGSEHIDEYIDAARGGA